MSSWPATTQRPVPCAASATPTARPSYTCSLVAFADSGLSLERLKGVRFGLTQPYSTCGYLAVSRMLATADLSLTGDGNSFSYAGNHSAAALGVVQGKYDVAGVKTSIAGRYRHLGLDVIATSPSYPGFSMVANAATLDEPTLQLLQGDPAAPRPARHPEIGGTHAELGRADPQRHGPPRPLRLLRRRRGTGQPALADPRGKSVRRATLLALVAFLGAEALWAWSLRSVYEAELRLALDHRQTELEASLRSLIDGYGHTADVVTHTIVDRPEVRALLAEASNADPEQARILRGRLYRLLYPTYSDFARP